MPTSLVNEKTGASCALGTVYYFHPILETTDLRVEPDARLAVGRTHVGGAHARLSFLAGEWRLRPVPALDRPMNVERATLQSGDVFAIGEARIRLHTIPSTPHLVGSPPPDDFEAAIENLVEPGPVHGQIYRQRMSAAFALAEIARRELDRRPLVLDAFNRTVRLYGDDLAAFEALRLHLFAELGVHREVIDRALDAADPRHRTLAACLLAHIDPLASVPAFLSRLRRQQDTETNDREVTAVSGILESEDRDAIEHALEILTPVVHDSGSPTRRRWAVSNLGVLARGGVDEAGRVLESLLGQAMKPYAALELALMRHPDALDLVSALATQPRRELADDALYVLAANDLDVPIPGLRTSDFQGSPRARI